jgi:hypothetical protein
MSHRLMERRAAQVFRTYNASITLDALLHKDTNAETVEEKKAEYDRANKEASLCPASTSLPIIADQCFRWMRGDTFIYGLSLHCNCCKASLSACQSAHGQCTLFNVYKLHSAGRLTRHGQTRGEQRVQWV